MQEITIPIDSDGFIVKSTEAGTAHRVSIKAQPIRNISRPLLVVEIRRKGSTVYETVDRFKIGIEAGFNFTASLEEYRFTVVNAEGCGILNVFMEDFAEAGENDNSNLDTEVIEQVLSGDDYVGSNYSTLAQLNSTRANPAAMSWALVADNGNGSPGIAVSDGISYSILESGGGANQEEVLLEGLASGFLYVNNMRAG